VDKESREARDLRAHRAKYARLVYPSTRNMVERHIGRVRICESKDPYFNDIPLKEWDILANLCRISDNGVTSLSISVCTYKEAAQQIRDQFIKESKKDGL